MKPAPFSQTTFQAFEPPRVALVQRRDGSIVADDPPIEQPEAFVRALRAALGSSLPLEKRSKP